MITRALKLATLVVVMTTAVAAQNDFEKVYSVCGKKAASDAPCATPPHAISTPDPEYSKDAQQNKIVGTVVLWLIVGPDGSTHNIRVARALGHGLDEKAVAAVRRWKFAPSTIDGKPVPVTINVEVNFRLYGNNDSAAFPGPLAQQDAAALYTQAFNAQEAHDCATTISLATRVTQIVPQHWGAWNLLGLCYLQLDEISNAEAAFKRQIEVSPQSTFAYNNLGRVYLRRSQYDSAIAQFRKQLETNPRDHYSLANLAIALRDQKKYREAIAAYQDAVAVTPDNTDLYIGLLDCYLSLGMQDQARKSLDKAAALASSASAWNSLAWVLARHNTQLERAEQYAKLSVSLGSSNMTALSLDPVTPRAYTHASSLAAAWDTLGWILFLRGDAGSAEKYILPSCGLLANPTTTEHLAQLYQKLGRKDDALKYAALTIAVLHETPYPNNDDLDAVSEARDRIRALAPSMDTNKLVQDAAKLYDDESTVAVPNPAKQTGTAQFAVLLTHASPSQARLITGDGALQNLASAVATHTPGVPVPDDVPIEIPRWGTLSCLGTSAQCTLKIATARDAVIAQLKSTVAPSELPATKDSNAYSSESLGIALRLPEGWSEVAETAATLTTPATVIFNRNDTLCSLAVMRIHLEATEDTFNKLAISQLKNNSSSHELAQSSVMRDGVGGVRTTVNYEEQEVEVHAIIETFTAGDVHYQLVATAPLDAFERYSADLETILGSLRFPGLHVNAKDVAP